MSDEVKSLKVGDEVACFSGQFSSDALPYKFQKVAKLTKHHIVLENGSKYNNLSGYSIEHKGRFHRPSIKPATQVMKDAVQKRNLVYEIGSVFDAHWTRAKLLELPLADLRAAYKTLRVAEIMKKTEEPQK